MECIKYLNSYDEVSTLISTIQKRRMFDNSFLEHYRGQGRPEYKLVPTIARSVKTGKEIQEKESSLIEALQSKLKMHNLEKNLRVDKCLNEKENLWNILIQSQHLGIPTRFLDWSLKWEIGLWFAVENPANDNIDGQFWIFSVPNEIHLTDTYYKEDITNLDQTYFINAPIYWSNELEEYIGEIKRQRQQGKFTVSPYNNAVIPLEEQAEMTQFLEKYCIPASIKGQIRLELTSKGIHEEWLYYRENNNAALNDIIKSINKE